MHTFSGPKNLRAGVPVVEMLKTTRFKLSAPRPQGTQALRDAATLDNLHEAVATLEDTERIAYPITKGIENELRDARAALRARENAATVDPD